MNKKTYFLLFILALAIFLRVWGIDYGLPYFFINDERALVYGALKMGELKTLIPAFHSEEFRMLYYPPLMPYIYLIFLVPFILIQYLIGSFSNFVELANYFILNPTLPWLVSRIVTALMGVATVYLIYLIGKKVWNHWVGLIAASFLTLSFLHIQLSHFTRPWVPILFFNCLIILFSFYIYKSSQRKHYLWLGLISGLAFGVSYTTSLSLFVFLIAHFFSGKFSFWEKLKDKKLWLCLTIFFLFALVFILLHPQEFMRFFTGGGMGGGSNVVDSLMGSKSLKDYLWSFSYYFKVLLFYEPLIFIFSLLGIILLWFKSKKIFFIFLSWPVFYISALYFLFHHAARYVALILPWLILLASYTFYILVTKFSAITKKPSLVKIVVLILVFVYPLIAAIQYDYLLSQKDTRILAKEWVEENILSGAKIISNWSYINPIPTKEAILFQKELDESSLRVADRVLLTLDDEDYPQPAYRILKLAYINKEKVPGDPLQFIQGEKYQYFLEEIGFWGEDAFLPEEKQILQKAKLIQEFKQGQAKKAEKINGGFLRPIFILFSLERLGPTVRIYKLLNEQSK